ncbi:MAG: LysE family translocator [Verrucomicrobia bacterium]|nr:LysE family translocator [Verrucomicrobiota bacterium]
MNEISFFLKGILIGFAIAAPVGPIGILCIKRTLIGGRLSGFFTGLGAALADAVYGCVGAFGLTVIAAFLLGIQGWMKGFGGLFLLYLGVKTFIEKPAKDRNDVKELGHFKDFAATFFLTLTNPMTILSFMAILAGLGLGDTHGNYPSAGMLVLGVFLGSLIWWLILAECVTLFRKKVSEKVFRWINRLAGLLIIAFGLLALSSLIVL